MFLWSRWLADMMNKFIPDHFVDPVSARIGSGGEQPDKKLHACDLVSAQFGWKFIVINFVFARVG